MNKTFLRFTTSLAVVLAAYLAYALLAVPLIEPEIDLPERRPGDSGFPSDVAAEGSSLEELERLFPAGAWELDRRKTKILDTQYGKLLFWDFRPFSDGSVQVRPFSLIFYADGADRADPPRGQAARRPIVMRAPDGAVLKFDRPLRLDATRLGQLIGGRLRGDIRLYRPASSPTARDGLEITTRNVQIDQQRIFTPHDVQFRFGPHWGTGRNLVIQLIAPSARHGRKRRGLGIRGVKSLELVQIDQVHLDTGGRQWLPGPAPAVPTDRPARGPPGRDQQASTPLEIACRGPFRFDFERSVASFEDRVDVRRIRSEGPIDQLNCELLEVYFVPRSPARLNGAAPSGAPTGSTDWMSGMDVQRLVAEGRPVTVRSSYQMQAQRLEYELAPAGQLGVLWADGPGKIYGGGAGQPPLVARWKKELVLQPDGREHVVSLLGGAAVRLDGAGQFEADELHFWVKQVADPGAAPAGDLSRRQFAPDKMLALGHVRMDSPRLSGATSRVEAWFESQPERRGDPRDDQPPAGGSSGPSHRSAPAAPLAGSRPVSMPRPNSPPDRRLHVSGQLVRLRLVQQGSRIAVQNATIAGDVRVVEIQANNPADAPLRMTGDVPHPQQASSDHVSVEGGGGAGSVAAGGLSISADQVNLDQVRNRLWIDGPGKMILPPQGGRLPQEFRADSATEITWKGGMEFDGHAARFDRRVTTLSHYRLENGERLDMTVTGERLDVTLSGPIDFSTGARQPGRAELQQLVFSDHVLVDNHRRDGQNRLVAVDQVHARRLTLDERTNRLTADGPGWATTWSRGEDTLDRSPARAGSSEATSAGPGPHLNYAKVDFQRGIFADLAKREIHFVGRVRAVYGPVAGWDDQLTADRPGGLGEKGILLTCDRLIAAEMGPAVNGRRMVELQALGNTYLEGRGFTATAQRMSYDRSKDLFVLEGTTRQDAQLRRLAQGGGPEDRAAARKILYWRRANRVQVDDARYLDLSHFGAAR